MTAAKGIQSYILASDKLRDMVGASNLVADLPDFFEDLLQSLGLVKDNDYRVMSGAAGNARILIRNPVVARQALSIWPLLTAERYPGLPVASGMADYPAEAFTLEVMDKAERMLRADRQILFPTYPLAGPAVFRYPRSGRPAETWGRTKDGETGLDAETLAKIDQDETEKQEITHRLFPSIRNLTAKPRYEAFPLDFEEMAGDRNYLAVIHADVNGLGKVLDGLRREAASLKNEALFERFAAFSTCMSLASETALRETILANPDLYLPCRPLVCAGDDLTMVMPAAHALHFVRDYLENLEKEANQGLVDINIRTDAPITAAAGVAFVKKSFPFAQSYELCEGLCKFAKDESKREQSAIAFWRITDATAGGWEEVSRREATGVDGLRLTCNPYLVGDPSPQHASIEALFEGVETLKQCSRGAFRQTAQELFTSKEEAKRRFRRQLDVLATSKNAQLSKSIETCFASLGAAERTQLPMSADAAKTPMLDLLTLLALQSNGKETR